MVEEWLNLHVIRGVQRGTLIGATGEILIYQFTSNHPSARSLLAHLLSFNPTMYSLFQVVVVSVSRMPVMHRRTQKVQALLITVPTVNSLRVVAVPVSRMNLVVPLWWQPML